MQAEEFSTDNYQFSGGLHGVSISVVNALSTRVEVAVQRQGNYIKWPLNRVNLLHHYRC